MDKSTKDQVEGAFHEAKGKVKETAGRVVNDPDLETEGQAENLGGKLQKKLGQIEKVLEK
ncbi:MAG: CsbD family protein [Candidatus Solibacter sp.]